MHDAPPQDTFAGLPDRAILSVQVASRAAPRRARRAYRYPILPIALPHDFWPPVDDRQHLIGLLRREHRDHAGDAHLDEALHTIKILAEAKPADFAGS